MSKFSRMTGVAAFALAISACSGSEAPDSGETTETRMDDVDVIDGTISDEMVDVDTITEVDATGEDTEEPAEEPAE
ncbi:hypothetical protein [Sphingorhabdus sp. 109]|jgi:hypothetical protein|uniref:hypothetical protein n=1 Tax=Sphingorhabdus sp. 109 TaxID=2653173 RepID=UPI0012F0DC81|nr:hypothetical protein [Sphingorhabdus sp. 109]VWX57422.1 conserved exported hypothetical protein [Sphingorhabdus sp. 109]